MEDKSITLWFGNERMRLDEFGNVYPVVKDKPFEDKEFVKPDLISFYQSVLRRIGMTVEIEKYPVFDPIRKIDKIRIVHKVKGIPTPHPFRDNIGYEYEEFDYGLGDDSDGKVGGREHYQQMQEREVYGYG